MKVEIESLEALDNFIARNHHLAHCAVQSVNCASRSFAGLDVTGTIFMGCIFRPGDEDIIRSGGGLIFPRLPALPFNPYRAELWTPDLLYSGLSSGYEQCTDAVIYRWWRDSVTSRNLESELACTLHDHSMTDALIETMDQLGRRNIIGVMGGHAAVRGSYEYHRAAVLGRTLADEGAVVLTGGGPGAMEAANLGASCTRTMTDMMKDIDELSRVPTWGPDPTEWARSAHVVRTRGGYERTTLGIPTWYYGHEPPNLFATRTAKYFNNALREESLYRLSRGGIVFSPGAAGTVQEIFQSLTDNYYAQSSSAISPMILLGRDYWTKTLPAWPLVQQLAVGRLMGSAIHLVDTVAEVMDALRQTPS